MQIINGVNPIKKNFGLRSSYQLSDQPDRTRKWSENKIDFNGNWNIIEPQSQLINCWKTQTGNINPQIQHEITEIKFYSW